MSNSFRVLAEMQEAERVQRFPELNTIIDMVNWWIVWICYTLQKKGDGL